MHHKIFAAENAPAKLEFETIQHPYVRR